MDRLAVIDEIAEPRALIALLAAAPIALSATAAASVPGTYAVHYNGPHPLYRALRGRSRPIYVGSAENLKSRLTTHTATLDSCRNLDRADFTVRTVPAASTIDAQVTEQLLQRSLRPPWNDPAVAGFGSRRQGQRRESAQLATPWDTLHPGRTWASTMTPRDPAAIAAAVIDAMHVLIDARDNAAA